MPSFENALKTFFNLRNEEQKIISSTNYMIFKFYALNILLPFKDKKKSRFLFSEKKTPAA